MTLKDAQKYVKRYIDSSFIVQNINERYECDDVAYFTTIEILDKYSTEYDTDDYNYIETTLHKALKIFQLQNK